MRSTDCPTTAFTVPVAVVVIVVVEVVVVVVAVVVDRGENIT